jgi:hypothetical protein
MVAEPMAEAARGRHPGFSGFDVTSGAPGSLALVVRQRAGLKKVPGTIDLPLSSTVETTLRVVSTAQWHEGYCITAEFWGKCRMCLVLPLQSKGLLWQNLLSLTLNNW